MPGELAGRVALVTGGSRGIGREIAAALGNAGAAVAITGRSRESLASAVAELRASRIDVRGLPADACDAPEAVCVVETVFREFGSMDILVCNAGGAGKYGDLSDLSDDDWRSCYDVNVLGIVHYVRAAEAYLRKSLCPRVVIISSISALQPGAMNPHYTAAKAAAVNLSKYLANRFARDGVLVNAVCPGPVHSSSWDDTVRDRAARGGVSVAQAWREMEDEAAQQIPLGRVGEGADVSGLVVFLASRQASWITGGCFRVDGGKSRSAF